MFDHASVLPDRKVALFLLKHRMVRASSAVIWMISRLYVKSHLEDETTLFA